jgi:hypothetical protein
VKATLLLFAQSRSDACLGLLQTGCGGSTPTEEQRVTDAINAYQSALLNGDGETACGYATPALRRRLAGRDGSDSPVTCAQEVASLQQVPGFVKLNRDVAVTQVAVHGDTAEVRAKSSSNPVVTAYYKLAKRQGQWKIEQTSGTS